MNILDIIEKKKHNHKLSENEIKYIIDGVLSGEIPDYQLSSFLMCLYFNSMDIEETTYLTKAMVESSEVLDLSNIGNKIIDKHSCGGVGDKITLMFMPIVASLGKEYKVAKLSGRSLGHTGGTIDKLESIPGFRTDLTNEDFLLHVKKTGLAIGAQTNRLVPSDAKIYAIRDVTCTVDIIPLIASSIVSKKIASGANYIILDVKFGKGAFIKTFEEAKVLAKTMVDVGKNLNKKIITLITDMNMPLGRTVGNSLELIEAIEFLKGNMPLDLKELTYSLIANILYETGDFNSKEEIVKLIDENIGNLKALNCFKTLIKNQGGDETIIENYNLIEKSKNKYEIKSENSGYISNIDALLIAGASKFLGARRVEKNENIDLSVGIYLNKHYNDYVKKGETIATLHYNDENKLNNAIELVKKAFEFSNNKLVKRKIVYEIIS